MVNRRNDNSAKGKKIGAPRGNSNRFRHGLHITKLPKKLRHIENCGNVFRRAIEAELMSLKAEIGIHDGAVIQSALRHERRCRLLERWLSEENDELKVLDKVQILSQISQATDLRDRCLRVLGLDKSSGDAWAGLDAQPSDPKITP